MDQTGFSENQELLQSPPLPASAAPAPEPSRLESKTKNKQKLLIVLLGVTAFLIILSLLVSVNSKRQSQQQQQNLNFTSPNQQSNSAYTQRLQTLKNSLDTSDPTDVELAPPPVNYQIQFLPESNY